MDQHAMDALGKLTADEAQILAARLDYVAFQDEFGFDATSALHRRVVADPATQTPFPSGLEWIAVEPSPIAGLGVFTRLDIEAGAEIGPAVIAGKRTPLGRYMNHSAMPNTRPVAAAGGDKWMIATTRIAVGTELTVNYRDVAAVAGFQRRR